MKRVSGIVCLPILLSGCATKIIREYYTAPERVVYVEPVVKTVKEASSFPVWVIVAVTFVVSLCLFMLVNHYAGKKNTG